MQKAYDYGRMRKNSKNALRILYIYKTHMLDEKLNVMLCTDGRGILIHGMHTSDTQADRSTVMKQTKIF